MIANKMVGLVNNNSAIRMMFEEGKRLAAEFGAENVYDFSLGNPNVPAPAGLNSAIKEILDEETSTFVHGYMNNAGYEDVRETIATSLNKRFETSFTKDNIICWLSPIEFTSYPFSAFVATAKKDSISKNTLLLKL